MRRGLVLGSAVAAGALAAAATLVLVSEPGSSPVSDPGELSERAARTDSRVDPVARRLLARAAAAPASTAYSGTQYTTTWSDRVASAQVVQVRHEPATGTTWQPLGADQHPASRLHATTAHAPSLLAAGAVDLMARHYSLAVEGSGTVAGRAVDVVVASRPGVRSPGVVARFWLDRATGLVLRREVYRPDGRPNRASAFVDVAVRATQSRDTADEAWPETLDAVAVRHLRRVGWTCPATLPGPLELVDARRDPATGVLHLSYADGIDSISLFQQRGRLDEDRLRGYRRSEVAGHDVWTRRDRPGHLMWSEDGMVYTLVADSAQRTVEHAVAALYPASDSRGSRWERLGRGLDRVASWFNLVE